MRILWTGVAIASAAAWGVLAWRRGRFWSVHAFVPPPQSNAPRRVAAVVPARDEAGSIERAITSLLAQRLQGELRLYVVDDHSTDETLALAKRAAGGHEDRLTVLSAPPLPSGWSGKLWAVSQGVAVARAFEPDYFLLTDADVVHAPGSVAGLLAQAEHGGFDLVSLMVRLRMTSPSERMLLPAFVFFFLMLYPPAWISDPRRDTAGAAGGCMLVRAEALARSGGIEAIRGELIDDCALAQRIKRSGGRVWLGLALDTESVRAYNTFGEIWRMVARTAFTQLRYSPMLLAGTVAGLLVTYIAPPALAIFGSGAPRYIGIAAWLAMSALYAPTLKLYGRSWLFAPALPGVAAFYLTATTGSALRYWRGQGGNWKGRIQATVPARHY